MKQSYIIVLFTALLSFQFSPNLHAQSSDDFGMDENTEAVLVGFGDLLDFTVLWEALEVVVDTMKSLIDTVWAVIEPFVASVGTAITDVLSAITSMGVFQALLDGLQAAMTLLEDVVDAIQVTVDALESLNPFMALNEIDDEMSIISSDDGFVEWTDEILGDLTILMPEFDDNGNPTNVTILTNPGATLSETANSVYSESASGNPWGDLWINPTIIDPIFQGVVTGFSPVDLGLGEVNNTSDLNKPISLALQQELNAKIQIADLMPENNDSPCAMGEVFSDQNYFYICVAPNTWKRTNLDASW